MKNEYFHFDSSDEEKENNIINNVIKVNYNNYLLTNILNIKNILFDTNDFKIKLGLILHNLADRLFKISAIDNIYHAIKEKQLGLNDNNYDKILNNIKNAFDKQLNQLFTYSDKENSKSDKDYIMLFNFLFDNNINIPETFTLKNDINKSNVKEILLKELRIAQINLKPLFKNPLNIVLELNDSKEIFACSKIANRNNKNKLKYLTVDETNNYSSSTIYNLPNSQLETFTDTHAIHYKTGNVQTEIFGLGNYNDIFQEILNNESYKENIVKRIFEVVQNKENSHLILPKKLNNFAEQLTHLLFIVEMQRNNATLFTAPMFLELIAKDNQYLKEEKFFPMSAKNAVSQARGVSKDYFDKLPNTHFMDYDISNVKKSEGLLKKEGHVLALWFKEIIGNDKLSYIDQMFDTIILVKIFKSKKIDKISLKNIQDFLDDIHKMPDYSNNLLIELEKNLNKLVSNFGNRLDQYLKLFKEDLIKKTIFSKEVKSLIETTFAEFQKILPKIDSFLSKVQKNLEEDIKKIIPEILQILCAKIKEWYNIDAPEYITNVKTVEEASDKKILKDITLKFNSTFSPASSKTKLKLSLSNSKKRERTDDKENYNSNKFLKMHDESLDNEIAEYYKIMGENTTDSISL